MNPQPTPEERLFSVIKEGKNADISAPAGKKAPKKRTGFSLQKLKALLPVDFFKTHSWKMPSFKMTAFKIPSLKIPSLKMLSLNKEWLRPLGKLQESFKVPSLKKQWSFLISGDLHEIDLAWAEHLFLFSLIALIVIGLPSSFVFQPHLDSILSRNYKSQDIFQRQIDALKPLEFYLTDLGGRNYFEPTIPQAPKAKVNVMQALDFLKAAVVDFQIVGMSWGESSKVMIRSRKEGTTYFLKKGQKIGETEIEVKDIRKNKITLSFQDAELDVG